MKKDKKNKIYKFIFMVFFISFIVVYFSELTGYYEYQNHKKSTLTEEKIKQFEKDVAEGKEVDIKDYVDTKVANYNNKFSNMGLILSNSIDYILNDGVKWFLKIIKTLFS